MFIFGTIGIFRRYIPISSALVACVRGFVGAAFLLLYMCLCGEKLSKNAIRANALVLIVSGTAIGFNWILLFESYRYTTVATATLCYYMAPIFVTLLSPMLLSEKLTARKVLCVFASLLGMVFVSGILGGGSGESDAKGVLFGLGAAVLYASVMILNKKLCYIGTYDRTVLQLASAAIVLVPYLALTEDFSTVELSGRTVALLLVVGIVHTGITYALYFGSLARISAQTVAIYSYIDPVVAILLSALLLKEALTGAGIFGAILILGATFVSDLPMKKK